MSGGAHAPADHGHHAPTRALLWAVGSLMTGRTAARSGIEMPGRMQLVEDDLDTLEADLRASMDRVDARLAKILWTMVAMLVSITTTCIIGVVSMGMGR